MAKFEMLLSADMMVPDPDGMAALLVSKLSAPSILLNPSNMRRNFTDESSSSSHPVGILEKGGAGGSASSRSGP